MRNYIIIYFRNSIAVVVHIFVRFDNVIFNYEIRTVKRMDSQQVNDTDSDSVHGVSRPTPSSL